LKIISLYTNEKRLIKKAISGTLDAQQRLYDAYAPKMLSVCRQYIRDIQFAEDVMVNGFLKVFTNLHTFKFEGSFEGWIRKIMIRESISYLRKKQFVVYDDEILDKTETQNVSFSLADMNVEHIQMLIDALPDGYRTVFVMYAIEGYKHQEIAEVLEITESTSKSQLFKARKVLQEKLKEQNSLGYGTE